MAILGPHVGMSRRQGLFSGARVNFNFSGAFIGGSGTLSRASQGTNLLSTSPPGFAYQTFANHALRFTADGLLIESARTQLAANPTAPATQTITLAATGNYTIWCNGSGSIDVAAGTATITNAGIVTNGNSRTVNCTATGTIICTVSGSLQAMQVEAGLFPSSFIPFTGMRLGECVICPLPWSSPVGTMFADFTAFSPINDAVTHRVFSLDNGTTTNRIGFVRLNTGFMNLQCRVEGANTFDLISPVIGPNRSKMAGAWLDAGGSILSVNGVAGSTSAVGNIYNGMNAISLGSRSVGSTLDGILHRLMLFEFPKNINLLNKMTA